MSARDPGECSESEEVWEGQKKLVGDHPPKRLEQELKHACGAKQQRCRRNSDGRPPAKSHNGNGYESAARGHAFGKSSNLSDDQTAATQAA
jgi:hypothetical protein